MRPDAENLAIIERLRPEHTALTNRLIRSETELERGERDVAELMSSLKEGWGTDNLDEIRATVRDNYEANTKAVDEFQSKIEAAQRALAEIDEKA